MIIFYSVDFRNRTLKNGNHWSPETVLGSRAYFNVEESILSIDRVRETDAGIYKCRIDYDKFPTKNYIVNLSVIGKFDFHLDVNYGRFGRKLLFF